MTERPGERWHAGEGDRLHGAAGIGVEGAVDPDLDLAGVAGEGLELEQVAVLAVLVDHTDDPQLQLLVGLQDAALGDPGGLVRRPQVGSPPVLAPELVDELAQLLGVVGELEGGDVLGHAEHRDTDLTVRQKPLLYGARIPEIDVAAARALTPGCEQVVHLNNAGASLAPTPVLDAMVGYLRREAEIGGYEAGWEAESDGRIDRTYAAIAELIGAAASEIAVVDSATRGWDLAVYSFPLRAGDRVVITRAEYGANAIALLQLQARHGCTLGIVEDDAAGQVDLDALDAELARGDVAFVSLVHVPSQGGLVNPAAEVGARCRSAGVPLVLDACQSAGQLPLDVDELGCDVLTATGRKFLRGPRGTGFVYVRSTLLERLDPIMLDLRAATWVAPGRYEVADGARRFETWERSVAGHIGLGVAIDHALGWGIDAIAARNANLAEGLRARLDDIAGVTVRDLGVQRSAIVTFTVEGVEADEVSRRLREGRVNTSVSTATTAQLDLPHRGLDEVVRASVHYYNTEAELDRAAEAVAAMRT